MKKISHVNLLILRRSWHTEQSYALRIAFFRLHIFYAVFQVLDKFAFAIRKFSATKNEDEQKNQAHRRRCIQIDFEGLHFGERFTPSSVARVEVPIQWKCLR